MANKYPYVASPGPLLKAIEHLRKSFPREVTATTLNKLGVAPKNESYVLNILRFLGVIDGEGKKDAAKAKAFLQQDNAFTAGFEALVKEAYDELFELHGEAAWSLDRPGLTQFFRTSDHSSDLVGRRQAGTFATLAALSGHAEIPSVKPSSPARQKSPLKKIKKKEEEAAENTGNDSSGNSVDNKKVGMTVRIEVNLPADGNQETYDRIFRSIRKNLFDGE